ncbi:MAG: Condensation domain protein [Bacteroidetes bacterium ADurb.Bin139]|jgi:NRPS condensation-like uncharacterized protein|nr:MAG: Condensation domain protein [Bacteroidetes bacterium ADurb.Bin139]
MRAELWDKLHFILGNSTDRMIRVSLWYDGLIQLDILKKALGHVTDKNPILHSAFRDHAMNPYWEIRSYSIDDMLTAYETNDPEQAKQQFFRQVIPVESNVQYRIAVINHDGKSLLCLMINHMCTDGRGVQTLLKQIAATYSKIHENLPVPEIKSGSRAYAKIYTGFGLRNRLAARFLLKNITRLKEKRTFAYTPEDQSDDLLMVTAKWTAGESAAIKEFAKIKHTANKTGATVNDVLLAFYTHALYQTCNFPKEKPLTITCMVDNRRYIKETEATGLTNHVGLMQVRMVRCGSTVGETLAEIVKVTTLEKKKRFFGLSGIPLIRLGYHLPFFLVKPGTSLWFLNPVIGFSNMGVIHEELFHLAGLNVVEGMFVGPQQYKPYLTVYIHMMCDALYFTTAVQGNEQDRQKIMQLFDNMKYHMQEFVNGQHH